MNDITTWLRAFFALQATAMDSRGFVEVDAGTDDASRWPRTSGHDVISIAAVLDPYLREMPAGFGAHAMARRWLAIMDELTELALVDPRDEYAGNRSFWRALPAVCVYLHSSNAPLPPHEVWDALFTVLADETAFRNVGGDSPFKPFDVKTWDDLYIEQFKFLRDARGSDDRAAEMGMGGGTTKIPRTTNADVAALANYWSHKFADVKEVFGHQGAMDRWKRAIGDVDAIARKGDPNAPYPKNNAFWRDLKSTAIYIAVADEAPSKSDMFLDSLKASVKNLPETAKNVASALGEAAGDVAQGVGKIANEAGKGLFSGFGGPLLVGAGLLGVFLISRNRSSSGGAS
ncbi:hypothetical protein BH11MYX2_BH11MYX2_36870 [soil metagenome]